MMGVSPWFFTNLPEYDKNWMWPDELMLTWADRWTQVLTLQPQQPDYVEIISWNDFGEVLESLFFSSLNNGGAPKVLLFIETDAKTVSLYWVISNRGTVFW